MKLILFVMILSTVVEGWSSLHRNDRSYLSHRERRSLDHNYYKVAGKPFKACKDTVSTSLCEKYQKLCEDERVNTVCKRTCGRCPAVSPLSCSASQLGCCWDNITKVENGCPACKDTSGSCSKSHSYCGIAHIARACPQTCGVCSDCSDDKNQGEFCGYWKKSGMCENAPELMLEYCKKTCDMCEKPRIVIDPYPKYYSHRREMDDETYALKASEQISDDVKKAVFALLLHGNKNQIQDNNVEAKVVEDSKKTTKKDSMPDILKFLSTESGDKKRDATKSKSIEEFINSKPIQQDAKRNTLPANTKSNTKQKTKKEAEDAMMKLLTKEVFTKQTEDARQRKRQTNNNQLLLEMLADQEQMKIDKKTLASEALLDLLVNDKLKKQKH